MSEPATSNSRPDAPPFLGGGGVAGATARSVDWARTPLGPVESWPRSLQTVVGTLLRSRHPMFLWWGPELIQFYNDGYLPSFGKGKHPAAMGQQGRECWQEIWPIIGPQIDDVMTRGLSSWHEDQLVPIFRNGRIEEVYWTYGYSPVFDDDGHIGGTLVVCTETTGRVLLHARQQRLRVLAETTARASDGDDVLIAATQVLGAPTNDIPFALTYRTGAAAAPRRLASFGLTGAALEAVDAAVRAAAPGIAEAGVVELEIEAGLAQRPWLEPIRQAFLARLTPSKAGPGAFMVFGLSPRLPFDDACREHLAEVAGSVAQAWARIEAFRMQTAVESERRNLLLQAPVATALMTGPEHVFELANPLYCEVVGRTDIVGKTYLQAFPELAGTALPGILDRVYRTGEPFVANEYPVSIDRHGRGREDCFFNFNLEPIRDSAGAVYGMMAVAVDITDQVRARQVLEKAQQERETLLSELEAANRAKDEFLAILGHELRNPLAPIVTALQLMKMRDGRSSSEQQVIERQVRHMVRLVDDLLDVSRITRGKVELRQEAIEIAQPIAEAVEMTSGEFEQRRHELRIEVPAEGLTCSGDAARLAQVFANLLSNAALYTPPGGHVAVSARREKEDIVVSVRDDGAGIASDLLPRMFDPFVQGKRTADRRNGSLGLGLTVVKNLVGLHGGTVEVHSRGLNQGSEFVVRLPATRIRATVPPPVATRIPTASGRRVLVVDDNVDAAEMLGELLRAAGNSVVVVNDPVSALEAAGRVMPEVAILDIGLPVMDGYELAARLRQDPAAAGCRMIALTGYGQETDRERSERAGFHQHFVKPVDLDDLLKTVAASGIA